MAVKYNNIYDQEYTKALGNSVTTIEGDRDAAIKALESNKKIAKQNAQNTYNKNANALLENKNEALRQAYISRMKESRELPQTLARQGLNGGVSETTQAAITRNYANNRNAAEKNYRDNKTNLDTNFTEVNGNIDSQFNTDLANLKSSYSSLISNAKQNAVALATQQAAQRYNALQAEEAAAQQAAQQAALLASSGGSGPSGGSSGGTVANTNNVVQPPFMEKRTDESYKNLNRIAHRGAVVANWNKDGYHYVKYANGDVVKTKR